MPTSASFTRMHQNQLVKATLPDIAKKAISSLIKTQGIGDLYRLYAIAKRDGIDYNLIDVPTDFVDEAKPRSTTSSCVRCMKKATKLAATAYPGKRRHPDC